MSIRQLIFTGVLIAFACTGEVEAKTSACEKPVSDSVAQFTAAKCDGNPGTIFTAGQATGKTVVEGLYACQDLEDKWRAYCSCENKEFKRNRPASANEITFNNYKL